MSDDGIELSRRKVLGGLVTIGAAGAAAGAGTMAMWSDTESSTGNTVSAGSLDLVTGSSSDGSNFSISASDLAPGETVTVGYFDLKNDGSIDGYLDYEITSIQNNENGIIDPESDAGDSDSTGELQQYLLINADVDRSPGNGDRNSDENLTSGFVGLSTGRVQSDVLVSSGGTVRVWVDVQMDSSAPSTTMTDSVNVDSKFHLTQTQ